MSDKQERRRRITVLEASRECGTDEQVILHFIREEWIVPAWPQGGTEPPENRQPPDLDEEDLARAHLIVELKKDFGVNDEAIPIILHLIDQLYLLRNRFRSAA